jgi:hypothetical protein
LTTDIDKLASQNAEEPEETTPEMVGTGTGYVVHTLNTDTCTCTVLTNRPGWTTVNEFAVI